MLKQLLRHGRIFREGKTAWTKLHRAWLARQRLDDPLAQEALEQLLIHVDGIERQLDTLDARLAEIAGSERWGAQVQILTRFRGIATITALGLIAEIGDFARFAHPRELAAWLGIIASEFSSGDQQHRGQLTWGATEAEADARLPGDELLDDADGVATRAIEIRAPTSAVWPWIAQMGPSPRGGAYTYDWIENLLGLNMHSADTVLPEFQHPEVGDMIGLGANRMRLVRVEPERVLAWRSQDGNWVWTFVLNQTNGTTRLISRNRFRLPRLVDRIGMVPMEPASLLMERKMLLGIKLRAERLAVGVGEVSKPSAQDLVYDSSCRSGRGRHQALATGCLRLLP